MSGFLFNEIIFGPVKSRRLGVSLGINLLPIDYKYCTFNCVYCECGWNEEHKTKHSPFPKREEIALLLRQKSEQLVKDGVVPNNITFAGNGEPTIHPDFARIVDDTIILRDEFFPKASTTVLSNASLVHKPEVFNALLKVDNNILKLDAGSETQFQRINLSKSNTSLAQHVENLSLYKGNLIIQTLFLTGTVDGKIIDNTNEEEVGLWLDLIKKINPKKVMIYPIDRETPAQDLNKIHKEKLMEIASRVNTLGIKTEVY
ncbi:MAG: radical SAM protein [Bacteroidetes bacterium]|nr:radical SAM protein [Bacteroidota bacterium]